MRLIDLQQYILSALFWKQLFKVLLQLGFYSPEVIYLIPDFIKPQNSILAIILILVANFSYEKEVLCIST